MRGRGIGRKLMDRALQVSEGRECRLVATREGMPLYERLGFQAAGQIFQHQGTPGEALADERIEWARADDVATLGDLDRAACGMDRAGLIRLLCEQARIAVLRQDGTPIGFAALRAFGRGKVAGPVVAQTIDDARSLLSFLFAGGRGDLLRVDTPESSGLSPWLATQGLIKVGGGIAMHGSRLSCRQSPLVQTFALASQALG
jgi:Acetyltransferase (GNAT) domain